MRRSAVLAAVLALALPAAASARILKAETVLPPGQSGYVSLGGVASGTGSPHLDDQLSLYTSFRFKPALFDPPGDTSSPRAGVRIVRDRYGVPDVHGDSDFDAWWGVGYAVAEDRLFQLELFRRATSGRLAEILGPDYLDDDLIARRDYYTDAEIRAMESRIPASLLRRTEAYRDGINAYIAAVRNDPSRLPGEFAALGVNPADWTVEDSLRIGVFLARTIPSGDGAELDNALALRTMGAGVLRKVVPLRTPGRIYTVPRANGVFPSQPGRTRRQEKQAFTRSARFVRALGLPPRPPTTATASAAASRLVTLPQKGGSYMFAISKAKFGKHGKVRKPGPAYLFNGPQLGYSIPELFVEFEVSSPVQHVRGVSAAGIPLVGIGHNGRVAWGFTSGESDEDDLYAEKLTGQETYTYKGAERQMDCRDEQFQYRTPPTDLPTRLEDLLGGNPQPAAGVQTERICRTVHGPVQSRGTGWAYARRYAVWGRELETIVGLTQLNDARDIRGVDRAMRKVTWNENVIAADSRGSIGYWHPGLHPLRPRGWDERLPFPGTGEAEWRGLLPRSRTPRVINPKRGYLFNWNNMPSAGWTNGDGGERERTAGPLHRSAWLRRLVKKVAKHPSYARARAIDRSNGTVAQQRPVYGKRLRQARRGSKGDARSVLSALIRWDGHYDRVDGNNTVDPGVAIWEQFKTEARGAVFGRYGSTANLLDGQPSASHQFDISNEEAFALRKLSRRGVRLAASRAASALTKRFGTASIAAWREPRRMYEVTAQGAATPPPLPFFDRGTWQESVAVGP